jgi:hypothetical protein
MVVGVARRKERNDLDLTIRARLKPAQAGVARRPRKTLSAWEYGGIWATERIRNCLDLRLIGEKAGDFVRKVEKSLSSTPGL